MLPTREFDIADVLSVFTGRLYTSVDCIQDVLSFLTQCDLFTHQLPRAFDFCKPRLFHQHPWLATVDVPRIGELAALGDLDRTEAIATWLECCGVRYGKRISLTALDGFEYRDPIEEASGLGKPVVVVAPNKTTETDPDDASATVARAQAAADACSDASQAVEEAATAAHYARCTAWNAHEVAKRVVQGKALQASYTGFAKETVDKATTTLALAKASIAMAERALKLAIEAFGDRSDSQPQPGTDRP